MNNTTNHIILDIQDIVTELKNDIKSLECLADIGTSGAAYDRTIKLSLFIPPLENLT